MERQHTSSNGNSALRSAAMGLGMFSIGLGLAELLAPRAMARATGMSGRETLVRAYGLREIVNGIGLLASPNPRPWLWGRVAGDALDMSTLAVHANPGNPLAPNAKRAMLMAAPIGALDLACAMLPDGQAESRGYDYSDRVGMPRPADAMRGAARDFMAPRDMRQPEPLRPYV